METRKPWKYHPGDVINGRTIKRHERDANRTGHRVYGIEFFCCGHEAEIMEVSLERAKRTEPEGHIAYCQHCSRKRKRTPRKEQASKALLFASFPRPGPIALSTKVY